MEPKLLTAARFTDSHTGCSYRYVYSDTEYFRPHYHEYYEVFLLLEGEALHIVNGEQVPLSEGCLVLVRPADCHDYLSVSGKPFSMLNITFTSAIFEELIAYLGAGFAPERLLSPKLPPMVRLCSAALEELLARMTDIRAIVAEDTARLATAMRILLFSVLTNHFSAIVTKEPERMPLWLAELVEKMGRDGNFTYGTARMLTLSGKSREHLSRSCKRYLGQTPAALVNDLRLNFVANMLKNSNHAIADIVFESGFGNLGWASTLFCRKYGVTMSAYRKS
ncbi:MAG: helix-turn-helix domain-containing protein [Clostridia bacterium]|nr:helix-turn-helix domain-containing protein [Clostridia bacterium]